MCQLAAVLAMPAISAPLGMAPLKARLRAEHLDSVYGIVGASVGSSLAPRVVNTALGELGMAAVYVPFDVADFRGFFAQARDGESGLDALTVVRPHKEMALALADSATEAARRSGAANLMIREGAGWRAANTSGIVGPLKHAGFDAHGCRAAVVGCGGAGRLIAAELQQGGADVRLVNRGLERGRLARRRLGLPFELLDEFDPRGFDLLVNATPLATRLPFAVAGLDSAAAVVDLAYLKRHDTPLVRTARSRGIAVVDGRRVLAAELDRQFRLITGSCLTPGAIAVATGADD